MTSSAHIANPLLEGALAHAAAGRPVFPIWWVHDSGRCACGGSKCSNVGKHPLGDLVPNGVKQATTDEAVIRFWWERSPKARIGIATGNGLGVIDVDPRHGGDEALAELEKDFGKLPETLMVMTPSGGWHLFFRVTGFFKSTVGALGRGIDTRGDGGYVVAAPSPGYVVEVAHADLPHAEMPTWVVRLVNRGHVSEQPSGTRAVADLFVEGGRNASLTQLAGFMRRKGMGGDEILGGLLVSNRLRCRPPLDEAEIKHIAYGMERYQPSDPVLGTDAPTSQPRFLDPIDRARRLGRVGSRMPSGIPSLDKATRGGPLSGRTIVFGGAPGAGKTTLLVQTARHYAVQGHPLLIVASDEDADGLEIRWGQNENIERDELERGDADAIDLLIERLSLCPLFMLVDQDEDDASFEDALDEFSLRLAEQQDTAKRPVICVDSLQTMRCREAAQAKTQRERIDVNVRVLKRASKKLDALVIGTSELARGAYRNADERTADLAAFKESGGIEYGVAVALVLRSIPNAGGDIEVAMPKNRLGQQLGFQLAFDRRYARFSEVPTTQGEAPRAFAPEERLSAVKKQVIDLLGKHLELAPNAIEERLPGRRQTILVAIEELEKSGVVMRHRQGRKATLTLASAPGREAEIG